MPLKRIPLKEIVYTPYEHESTHTVFLASVSEKSGFLKRYQFTSKDPYLKGDIKVIEGIGSDCYAFLLDKSRVAEATIVSDEHDDVGIFSEKNSAGFKSGYSLWLEKNNAGTAIESDIKKIHAEQTSYLEKTYFTKKSRHHELKFTMRFLDEADQSWGNVGLNNIGLASRIDFDYAFATFRYEFFYSSPSAFDFSRDISFETLIQDAETELYDDSESLQNYYSCLIKAFLLKHAICIFSERHTTEPLYSKELSAILDKNCIDLSQALKNSIRFQQFIESSDLNFIKDEIKQHFEFEIAQNNNFFNDYWQQIQKKFYELRSSFQQYEKEQASSEKQQEERKSLLGTTKQEETYFSTSKNEHFFFKPCDEQTSSSNLQKTCCFPLLKLLGRK